MLEAERLKHQRGKKLGREAGGGMGEESPSLEQEHVTYQKQRAFFFGCSWRLVTLGLRKTIWDDPSGEHPKTM